MMRLNLNWRCTLVAFAILSCTNWLQVQAVFNCYQCDSTSNANCITDLTKLTETLCAESATGCFTSTDATGKVTRGCLTTEVCADDTNCRKCTADKCNNNNICKNCDSSATAQCAQTDGKSVTNAVCSAAATKCVTQIDATNANTVRRCATDDDVKNCNSATCQLCDAGNCNVGIFPTTRKSCYQCSGDKCGDLTTNTDITSQPCLLYKSDETCYTFGTSATTMQRGCVSDKSDSNKCSTPSSNTACVTCNDNSCNNLAYTNEQQLTCIQCDTAQDANCPWGQATATAKSCSKPILYYQTPACYTLSVDGKVTRGCLYDLDENAQKLCASTDPKTCSTCTGTNGCNSNDSGVFSCIRCRSDQLHNCRDMTNSMDGGTCTNPVTQNEAECFMGKWNGIIIRGCLVDADETMKFICNDKSDKQCEVCKGQDCNKVKWSGAGFLAVSHSLLIALLFTLYRMQ